MKHKVPKRKAPLRAARRSWTTLCRKLAKLEPGRSVRLTPSDPRSEALLIRTMLANAFHRDSLSNPIYATRFSVRVLGPTIIITRNDP